MEQLRLVNAPPRVFNARATWYEGEGWRLVLTVLREGECWEEASVDEYERLSSSEMLDALCESTTRRLLSA